MKKFKKISEKVILDNGYRKLISRDFDLGDGKNANFLISSHLGDKRAVIIMPINFKGEIIYIKEFRFGIEDYIYSFPMGAVISGDTLEDTVKKELEEETGYETQDIFHIGETIVANYDENIVDYFFVKCGNLLKQNLEIGEDIKVFSCSLSEFEEKIKNGIINCPLTLSCYTLAKLKGFV